ncbi:helix-turn-helix domain-containing protein [Nocardia nova]|uniref:helix-turn-helix domain-containing protein n=1 Tax=Nocardia nova TaxID=37330 RepID=UPI0033FC1EB8
MTVTPNVATRQSWASRLRIFRRGLGLNQQQFAETLNDAGSALDLKLSCDQQHVSRWERGVIRRPDAEYILALQRIGAPLPEAPVTEGRPSPGGFTPYSSPCVSVAAEGAERRKFLAAVAAAATAGSVAELSPWLPSFSPRSGPMPERAGAADVHFVREVTAGLRGLDQRHGGFAVTDSAIGLLRWSSELLHRCGNSETTIAMSIALADLARLTGWAYHDTGDQARARSYLTLALSCARSAGADSLAASILYVLGRISLIERQPREALRMFQLGQMSAQDASDSGESARLYSNEAWAHAMMGNRQQMLDALGRAEHEVSRMNVDPDPWTEVFFAAGEHAGLTSVIYNEFALTADRRLREQYSALALERALESLSASTNARPVRSVLFDQTTVAACRFRLGDADSAVVAASTALDLTHEVASARGIARLRSMVDAAEPYRKKSHVSEIVYQVQQLVLPAPQALA